MKTALLLVSLFALISCGNSGNKDNGKNQNEYRDCLGAVACLPPASPWKIVSSSVNFPKNFAVRMINRDFHFDFPSCPRNGFFHITHKELGKTEINFQFHIIPKSSFKVEIIDRGENCDNNAIFHSEDSVRYGVSTIYRNGRETRKEISVYLSN